MKSLNAVFLNIVAVLAAAVVLLLPVGPAFATASLPVRVPGPSTLALLSVGVAAAAIAARWIRRR